MNDLLTVERPLPPELGHCWVVPGFLSPRECRELIESAERRGFKTAETDYPPSYRNNERLVVDDEALAGSLYARIQSYVPSRLNDQCLPAEDGDWELRGLNERLRFCRYMPNQQFHIHQDGVHYREADCRSMLTFMIYLTDGSKFDGGDTLFYSAGPGASEPQVAARVRPRAGSLILFDHSIWHAGEAVTAGVKHILRSDLLYRRDKSLSCSATLQSAHQGYVWRLAALPHKQIASAGRDTTIRIWIANGELTQTLRGHRQSVLGLAAINGQLASVSRDRTLRLWDLSSGECRRHVVAHDAAILDVAALRDGTLATAGADRIVRIWSADLQLVKTLAGHDGWVWAVAERPGELVTGSEDGTVRSWNRLTAEHKLLLETEVPLRTVDVCPSSASIAAGDVTGRVTVGEHDEPMHHSFVAHAGAVRRVRFITPNLLATTGEDNAVRLWKTPAAELVFERRHECFATDVVALDRDLWSCSYDGEIVKEPWPVKAVV